MSERLTDFLCARIAEDEDEVQRLVARYPFEADDHGWHGNADDVDIRVGLGRGLAECEAKRRIVTWATTEGHDEWGVGPVLNLLALLYADHEDFDESWRP